MDNQGKPSSDECHSLTNMLKHQKLSSLQFEDLPNEMILQVLKNLGIEDLLRCGLVSKRIRTISRDESLWEKINLYNRNVPKEFVQLVVDSGCKYLSLDGAKLEWDTTGFQLKKPSKLRYLNLESCEFNPRDIEEILASCHSLEKLSLMMQN